MALLQQLEGTREALIVSGIDVITFERDNFDDRHELILAFDLNQADLAGYETVARFFERLTVGEDADFEGARKTLKTRCKIYGIADDRVVEALLAAEVADDRVAGAD